MQIPSTEPTFVDIEILAETDVKQEDVSVDDPLETPVKKEESECCDVESKIEIKEDLIFKTESADLSEFTQKTNEDPYTQL